MQYRIAVNFGTLSKYHEESQIRIPYTLYHGSETLGCSTNMPKKSCSVYSFVKNGPDFLYLQYMHVYFVHI